MTLHCIRSHYTILHNITHIISQHADSIFFPHLFSIFHLGIKGGASFTPRRFVESLRCAADHLHLWNLRTQDNHGCLGHRHFTDLHTRRPSFLLFFGGRLVRGSPAGAGWLDFGSNKNHSPWMLFGGMIFICKGILGWSSKETLWNYMKLYNPQKRSLKRIWFLLIVAKLILRVTSSVHTHRHLDTDTRLGRFLC